ncbi:hypothetical protein BDD12DRAFT_852748 [Trichophaea hybrida]|nr:hypothetical protein BDD12DRAFT_852748 [Trichophaea hybrida]
MGQTPSSSAGNSNLPGQPSETPSKTCYYELLSVERTATQDDIKKAYRKKALELHPDRNFNDIERATRLFAEVQTAYEVLSDPQERAWYDSHRDAILRGTSGDSGSGAEAEKPVDVTTSEDVLSWFAQFSVQMSYEDSNPRGFYVVLRRAFAKLVDEEVVAAEWEGVNPIHYPAFGSANDTYESGSVRDFYLAWSSFSTRKNFSWCDAYCYTDAPDRKVKRWMEKENMRLRETARREFSDTVVSFVKFVQKRDPRFTPNTQTAAEREAALLKRSREQAARQRAENAKKRGEYKEANWTKVGEDEEKDGLEGDGENEEESEEEEEEEEEEVERWECIVCKKVFQSAGQMDAHEKSKKHTKAVQQLKRQMMKENKEFDLDRDVRGKDKPQDAELKFTPMDDDDAAVEDILDDMPGTEAQTDEETEHIPLTTEDDPEAEDRATDSEKPPTSETKSAPEPEPTADSDSDEYVSREKFSARILGEDEDLDGLSSGLASTAISDHEDSKSATKMGKAKAKRAKRAQKAAEAEEQKAQTTDVSFLEI